MNNSEQKAQAGRLLENNSAYSLATRLLAVEKEKAMLEREIEELQSDSDRYQWLRNRPLDTIDKGGVFAGQTPENVILNGEDLDEYIDKAMGGGHE